ncbi:MAG: hypothetical protein LBD42_06110 [Desulfovibrio sp.]|jgi:hypothetical protein|nr:hypothetical protein [Desulfovibrio sp.]
MDAASAGIHGNLLARPGRVLLDDLSRVRGALEEAFPIPSAHKRSLPDAVRELSRLLTLERAELKLPYWAAPRFLAAYIYYFLPWNIYRMAWLLPGLDLPLRPGAAILDVGSGPLTLPLALWCARPDLRVLPLSFICGDTAVRPMEIGRDIFRRLAGKDSPWRIVLRREPLEKSLSASSRAEESGGMDCIMAGNVLNELPLAGEARPERELTRLMALFAGRLVSGGRVLLVEPGTRLGGKLIALARRGALLRGLFPLAPCTHGAPCPMLGNSPHASAAGTPAEDRVARPQKAGAGGIRRLPFYSGWCHFVHPAGDAPQSLLALSRKAQLEKTGLSVSCLLLQKPDRGAENPAGSARPLPSRGGFGQSPMSEPLSDVFFYGDDLEELDALHAYIMKEGSGGASPPGKARPSAPAGTSGGKRIQCPAPDASLPAAGRMPLRVISDRIRLTGEEEPGRYACCERGLALLRDAARVPSGGIALAPLPEREERDSRSGALLLRCGGASRIRRRSKVKASS